MALGEDNFLAWLYFNCLRSIKGSNPENNLVIVIRAQRASVQMGLKTYYIHLCTFRKIRFVSTRYHYSHVLVGRASSEATEPWVCLRTGRICIVCLYRQPSRKIVFCLEKPGSAKDFEAGGFGLESWLFQLVTVWSWMRYFSFPGLNFLIFEMGVIIPDSQDFCEDHMRNSIRSHQPYAGPET